MTLILLNVILCSAVAVGVVTPLVWAILTAHRDPPAIGNARLTRRPPAYAAARARRSQYEPVMSSGSRSG